MSIISQRLEELGIVLPTPMTPVAAYIPYVLTGNLVFISGQLPMENGELKIKGRLGDDVDLTLGQNAARLCGFNILAHLSKACGGDLDKVERCVKLGGFVSSAADFYEHPKVINGASELMEQVFGSYGQHARFAVGVANLPRNAAVEVDAIFALKV